MQEGVLNAASEFGDGKGDPAEELDVGQEEVVEHRDPDLGHDRISGSAEKGFDLEVLLDPFEEDLNLPTLAIDFSDGTGGEMEVVGEEAIEAVRGGVSEGHEAQAVWVFSASNRACQFDDLVCQDPRWGGV